MLDKLPTGRQLRNMVNSMAMFVEGYDDPRELHSIPKVRAFYSAFRRAWPYGLYVCCELSAGMRAEAVKAYPQLAGRLWFASPDQRPGLGNDRRDEHGRLFRHLHPEYLVLLFERLGFHLVRRWQESDRLGRPGFTWNGFIFELDTIRGRPLDRIERVLNRDTRDAT